MSIESFSEEQLGRLERGVIQMYTVVAATDSVADRHEWDAFCDAVKAHTTDEDSLVRAVMARILASLDGAPPVDDVATALAGLRDIRDVLDSAPSGATHFRTVLLEIGRAVAEGSGAQLTRSFTAGGDQPGWQRSSGTSAMERESIAKAAEALGLG